MKAQLVCLALLLALPVAAEGLSYQTAEGSFAILMARLSETYAKENDGALPTSWSDFDEYLGEPVDEKFSHIMPTKRYAFVSSDFSPSSPAEGTLLLITRRPFRESKLSMALFGTKRGLRDPGRYIVMKTTDGNFFARYVPESFVEQMFASSPEFLPAPDSEPLRSHEVAARQRLVTKTIILISLPLIVILIFRARRNRQLATT